MVPAATPPQQQLSNSPHVLRGGIIPGHGLQQAPPLAAQALRVFDEIESRSPGHTVSRSLLIRSLESLSHAEVIIPPSRASILDFLFLLINKPRIGSNHRRQFSRVFDRSPPLQWTVEALSGCWRQPGCSRQPRSGT